MPRVNCPRCGESVRFERPEADPSSGEAKQSVRFRCPGCGKKMRTYVKPKPARGQSVRPPDRSVGSKAVAEDGFSDSDYDEREFDDAGGDDRGDENSDDDRWLDDLAAESADDDDGPIRSFARPAPRQPAQSHDYDDSVVVDNDRTPLKPMIAIGGMAILALLAIGGGVMFAMSGNSGGDAADSGASVAQNSDLDGGEGQANHSTKPAVVAAEKPSFDAVSVQAHNKNLELLRGEFVEYATARARGEVVPGIHVPISISPAPPRTEGRTRTPVPEIGIANELPAGSDGELLVRAGQFDRLVERSTARWQLDYEPGAGTSDPVAYADTIDIPMTMVNVQQTQDHATWEKVVPVISDLTGAYALTPAEGIAETLYSAKVKPLDQPNKIQVVGYDAVDGPGCTLIDLRAGETVGEFPRQSPLWHPGTALSPDGTYCVGLNPAPYTPWIKRLPPELTIWKKGGKGQQGKSIPVESLILRMMFVDDERFVLLMKPKQDILQFRDDRDKKNPPPPYWLEFYSAKTGKRLKKLPLVTERTDQRNDLKVDSSMRPDDVFGEKVVVAAVSDDRRFLAIDSTEGVAVIDLEGLDLVGFCSVFDVIESFDDEPADDTIRLFKDAVLSGLDHRRYNAPATQHATAAGFSTDGTRLLLVERAFVDVPIDDMAGHKPRDWVLLLTEYDLATGQLLSIQEHKNASANSIIREVDSGIVMLHPEAGPARVSHPLLLSRSDPVQLRGCIEPLAFPRLDGSSLIWKKLAGRKEFQIGDQSKYFEHVSLQTYDAATAQLNRVLEIVRVANRGHVQRDVAEDRTNTLDAAEPIVPETWQAIPTLTIQAEPTAEDGEDAKDLDDRLVTEATARMRERNGAAENGVSVSGESTMLAASNDEKTSHEEQMFERSLQQAVTRDKLPWRTSLLWTPPVLNTPDGEEEAEPIKLVENYSGDVAPIFEVPLRTAESAVERTTWDLRATTSPDGSLLAVANPYGNRQEVEVFNDKGARLQHVKLTSNAAINVLKWHGFESTADPSDPSLLLTISDGNLTAWEWPGFKPQFHLAGDYEAFTAAPYGLPWIAASASSYVDLLDINDGHCLGRCELPTDGVIWDAAVSPDGRHLLVGTGNSLPEPISWLELNKNRYKGRDRTVKTYERRVFVWNLQTGDRAELPTSIAFDEEKGPPVQYVNPPRPTTMMYVGWLDANTPFVQTAERQIMAVDLEKQVGVYANPATTMDSARRLVAERFDALSDNSERLDTPLEVRIALPDKKLAERLASMLCAQYAKNGQAIGTGGDILSVTASVGESSSVPGLDATMFKKTFGGQAKAQIPYVQWNLMRTTSTGEVVKRTWKTGFFPGTRSRYYKGKKDGMQNPIYKTVEYSWKFPKDIKTSVLEEILERGVGLFGSLDAAAATATRYGARFKLTWIENAGGVDD